MDTELIVLALVASTAGLAVLAYLVRVPYPILLVVGGLALGFVPGVPEIELPPDLVLTIFLPPLLYSAAFFASLRDLRRNVRPISTLAIGLVIATMVAVAVVAHYVIGLEWEVAFVLGAVVSPTDAVAPAEILRRLNAPRRLITVVEGENLTNDWTALVLYRFAVAAVVSGTFSLWDAIPDFLLTGVGGLAVGLAVGFLVRMLRRRLLDDPPTSITVSLVTGYLAYLPAEELGFSGVIAAVTVGVYMGWHTPELTTPAMRIQGYSMWEIFQFVVNALLFLLVGLQFPSVIDDLSGRGTGELIGWACLISGVAIGVRLLWMFSVPYAMRALDRSGRYRDRRTDARERVVIGWAGMRGAVALAAALAIPLETDAGAAFPERDLIIFLTLSVILATLVLQGLTLGPLINRLGVCDPGDEDEEEARARIRTAEAALERLDELAQEDWIYPDTLERARGLFDYRRRRFAARTGDGDGEDGRAIEERSRAYQRLLREMFAAQRQELLAMRNGGEISDEVRRRVERDLDLEESRLE